MKWIILALLVYALFGAVLVLRHMRGMRVAASFGEWLMLILLWPFCLSLFVHLTMTQAKFSELEDWSSGEERKH